MLDDLSDTTAVVHLLTGVQNSYGVRLDPANWAMSREITCPLLCAARTLTTVKGKTVEGYVLRDAPGWTWKANGRDNEGRFDFLVIRTSRYGAGPPLHFHTTFEDSFFVLDGLLTVQLGDDVVELGRGDFATAPPGVPHSLTNAHADQSACRAVNLLTPGVGFIAT